jgi:hypothetical protein
MAPCVYAGQFPWCKRAVHAVLLGRPPLAVDFTRQCATWGEAQLEPMPCPDVQRTNSIACCRHSSMRMWGHHTLLRGPFVRERSWALAAVCRVAASSVLCSAAVGALLFVCTCTSTNWHNHACTGAPCCFHLPHEVHLQGACSGGRVLFYVHALSQASRSCTTYMCAAHGSVLLTLPMPQVHGCWCNA